MQIRSAYFSLIFTPFLTLLLLGGMQPAQALVVEDIYVARVLTSAQNSEALRKGAELGLLEVLIKVSGDPDVDRNSMIRQSLGQASRLYYQYSFSSTTDVLEVDGEEVSAWELTLHFDARGVSKLLEDAGLPVWGSNRPAVLVWMAVDEGEGRYLLSSQDVSDISKRLKQHAARRGLPLIFPVMDIEDVSSISVREVWGGFLDDIESASDRYRPDALLTAKLTRDRGGRWSANWNYRPGDRWFGLSRSYRSQDALFAEMIDRMANELASLYAHGGESNDLWLKVGAVDSVAAYAGLSQYLDSLALVERAYLDRVYNDGAWYRLTIKGQRRQLIETIRLDRKMSRVGQGDGLSRETALTYQWTD